MRSYLLGILFMYHAAGALAQHGSNIGVSGNHSNFFEGCKYEFYSTEVGLPDLEPKPAVTISNTFTHSYEYKRVAYWKIRGGETVNTNAVFKAEVSYSGENGDPYPYKIQDVYELPLSVLSSPNPHGYTAFSDVSFSRAKLSTMEENKDPNNPAMLQPEISLVLVATLERMVITEISNPNNPIYLPWTIHHVLDDFGGMHCKSIPLSSPNMVVPHVSWPLHHCADEDLIIEVRDQFFNSATANLYKRYTNQQMVPVNFNTPCNPNMVLCQITIPAYELTADVEALVIEADQVCDGNGNGAPVSLVLPIKIYSKPNTAFTVDFSPFPGDFGRVVNGEEKYQQYHWFKQNAGGDWDEQDNGLRFQPKEPGNYRVVPSHADGCSNLSLAVNFSAGESEAQPTNSVSIGVARQGIKSLAEMNTVEDPKSYPVSQTYFDKEGRAIQSVAVAAGPNGEDLVQPSAFDYWDRQLKTYLPFAVVYTEGSHYQPYALTDINGEYTNSLQKKYYSKASSPVTDAQPYGLTEVDETKDLVTPTKQYGPGHAWSPSQANKFIQQSSYLLPSKGTFPNKAVRRLYLNPNVDGVVWGANLNPEAGSDYEEGELLVTESVSEDNRTIVEYTSQDGRKMAVRQYNPNNENQWLTTYYIYDVYGRLVAEVPPKAAAVAEHQLTVFKSEPSAQNLGLEFLTWYQYDKKGRLYKEIRPGGQSRVRVFDQQNRVVLSQDMGQKIGPNGTANRWTFAKWDHLGRQVLSGELDFGTGDADQLQLQQQADQAIYEFEERSSSSGNLHGYTDRTFPILSDLPTGATASLFSVGYFDDYQFTIGPNNHPPPAWYDIPWNTSVMNFEAMPELSTNTLALPTGKKIRVLNPDASAEEWLTELYYYDGRNRVFAIASDNAFAPDGAANETWNLTLYDGQTDQVVKNHHLHTNTLQGNAMNWPSSIQRLNTYSYYPDRRLKNIQMIINGEDEKELVAYDYDAFGKMKTRHLSAGLQHVDYRYDIRGRLTHINDPNGVGTPPGATPIDPQPDDDIFGMRLMRENISSGGAAHSSATSIESILPESRYDGTLTGVQWKSTGDNTARSYSYSYDGYDRLARATYRSLAPAAGSQWSDEGTAYHNFDNQYDDNGNLTQLKQTGPLSQVHPETAITDNLTYRYALTGVGQIRGNQLEQVSEAPANHATSGYTPATAGQAPYRRDFHTAVAEYSYDGAGRLTADNGKGIASVAYNALDLPERIHFTGGAEITVVYAADGRKMKYEYRSPSQSSQDDNVITTWYADGFQYRVGTDYHDAEVKSLLFGHTEAGKVVYADQQTEEMGNLNMNWLYQFHIYDHQGNLRVAFQESYTKAEYGAGMEQINAQQEEADFDFVAETRELDATNSRTGSYSAALNPLTGRPMGPMKWVKVEAGDTVSMEAFAHYTATQTTNGSTWQQGLAGFLLGSLANSIYSPTLENGLPNPAYQQLLLLGSTLAAMGLGNLTQPDPTVPRAYLKYIHYDEDSQFVGMGIVPVTAEATSSYEPLFLQLVAQQNGFVQFFVANESLQFVYFDDISGMVRRPKIIQEAHYYPFGLPMAGLTTLGNPEYAYFFTGKELVGDQALQWYDYGARMYDVQIGRWTTHDPMYQMDTPYGYCGNNPVMFRDPDGRWFGAVIGFAIGYVGTGLATGDWGEKAIMNGIMGGAMGLLGPALGAAIVAGGGSAVGAGILTGMAGGMAIGAYNGSQINGGDKFDNIMGGMVMGMFTGALSGAAGGAVGGLWSPNTFGGMLLNAAAGGAAGGAVGGAVSAGLYGGNFWEGVGMGAAIGAGTAMVSAAGNRLGNVIKREICMREAAFDDGYAPGDPVPATQQELEKILDDPSFKDDYLRSDTKGKWEIVKNLRSENENILGKTIPTKDYRGVEKVQVSDRAFATYRKLYNTVGHELVHVTDFTSGNFRGWYDKQLRHGVSKQAAYNYAFNRTEANAYSWNVPRNIGNSWYQNQVDYFKSLYKQ